MMRFGLKTTVEEIAWTLVCRAVVRAMFELIGEMTPFPASATPPDEKKFLEGVGRQIDKTDLVLDPTFFRQPADLPLLEALKVPVSEWLVAHGASEADARCIVRRLPSYFVYALHQEWHSERATYERLRGVLDTPFAEASEREQAWERYAARLQKQINEPMFGEAFGLAIVYVPLRGYYEEPIPKAKGESAGRDGLGSYEQDVRRVVIDPETELSAWVARGDKDDAIRVIAGGPGSGKSSFAKMFAAAQTAKGMRVLYVPLHLIDAEKDLEEAIGQFVLQQEIVIENPIDAKKGERRLLLLLDGLDELAMQGKAAAEVAQKFILEVQRLVANRNHADTRVQVLIGGREIVVQMSKAELRKPRQVLHAIPYSLPKQDHNEYHDPAKLLVADQRDHWWANYAAAKGTKHPAMPKELRREDLDEVTSQPLLGYLVALSYQRGKIDFTKEVNRNEIYADLVTAVHARSYGDKPHPSVRGLELDEFCRLLEEVGIAVWHGDGRTTTSEAIFQRCKECGLDKLLDAFEEGAKSGATRLLTAFYFRQHGTRSDGARTFEFTHKSFGEYLIARRIVRTLEDVNEEMTRRSKAPGRGWDESEALRRWAEVFGPTAMDVHIHRFARDEVLLRSREEARTWQRMLSELIGWSLRHGMPVDKLHPRPGYAEEVRLGRNAEEALLACVFACACKSRERTHVEWPDEIAFGTWIRHLQGQRRGGRTALAFGCLGYLDLRNQIIHAIDLCGAELASADLSAARCRFAMIFDANLLYATLTDADLHKANLAGSNLAGASLKGATLEGANLAGANLKGANLEGANLEGANLEGAILEGADLHGARYSPRRLDGIRGTSILE